MDTRPNFLFLMTDQHRADHLGCYGNAIVRTPHIDSIAARGVTFDKFYVANPICMPNRATYMTGRMPSVHGVRHNGLPLALDAVVFTELLRAAGPHPPPGTDSGPLYLGGASAAHGTAHVGAQWHARYRTNDLASRRTGRFQRHAGTEPAGDHHRACEHWTRRTRDRGRWAAHLPRLHPSSPPANACNTELALESLPRRPLG
jgi:hypothetical protein